MSGVEIPETRDQKFTRQTKESFEYLGRFVQAFQQTESVIRMHCSMMATGGVKQQGRLNTILYHHSLTAMPLFEIMMGMIGQIIHDPDNKIANKEVQIANEIIKQSGSMIEPLIRQRNNLLHGHWMIGWTNPTKTDFSEVAVTKFKTTRRGYEVASTPKTIAEMKVLIQECEDLGNLLLRFGVCFYPEIKSLERNFKKLGKKWMTPEQAKKLSP